DRQVRLIHQWKGIGAEYRLPSPIADRFVDNGAASAGLHHAPAGILKSLQSCRFGRFQDSDGEGMGIGRRLHVHPTAGASVLRIRTSRPILDATAVQVEGCVASPRSIIRLGGESIPIRLMAPRPGRYVYARTAAQDLAHRIRDGAAVQLRVGLGDETPIEFAAEIGLLFPAD